MYLVVILKLMMNLARNNPDQQAVMTYLEKSYRQKKALL